MRRLWIAAALVALGVAPAAAQKRPIKLGIFTPTVEFADSGARLSYVQALAAAVERAAGRQVEGLSFTSLRSLRAAKVDVAVVDAACAVSNRWPVLAAGRVGEGAARRWALFARQATSLAGLRGKRLVTVKIGCGDRGFVEHGLLEGELPLSYFGSWSGKPDLKGAVAEVAALRGADAVFAPIGSGRGLRRLFVTGAIPGPALVQIDRGLDRETAAVIARAVAGFGGRGPIAGFAVGGAARYSALRRRLAGSPKRGVFALAPLVRFEAVDVIAEAAVPKATELAPLDSMFASPPERH